MHLDFSLFDLLLVLLVAWMAGVAAGRLGYPAVLGELAAGILFGPAVLGILQPSEGLDVLAEIGVFLMMLYIGMEVDYRALIRASRGGFLAAAGGFSIPFVLGFTVTKAFGFETEASLFLGLAMGVTSLATKSRILVDLDLLGTRIASVLFAAALICDTGALIIFAVIMGMVGENGLDPSDLFLVVAKAVIFFGVCIGLGIRIFPRIGRLLQRAGFAERSAGFTMVVLIGLVFAAMAELAGLHSILGAFLAGMFLREEVLQRKLSHEVTTMVRDLSLGFLAPIFFVSAGFHVDLSVFVTDLPLLVTIVSLAAVGKILGAALFYLPTGHGWREGLTIGAGMNGHGAVEIIIAGIALEQGLLNESLFSILILMAFVTTSSAPLCLKFGVEKLRRRGELAETHDTREGVLVVGATPLARLMAKELMDSEWVMLIDSNRRRCSIAEHEGLAVFHGNALNEDVMDIAGAEHARLLVSMTMNHEVNTVAATQARQYFGIPHVHALRHDYHAETPSGESVSDTGRAKPLFHIPHNLEQWNRRVYQEQVEIKRFPVSASCDALDFFAALGDSQAVLPLLVLRDGKGMMPGALDRLENGDLVVAVFYRVKLDREPDPFTELTGVAPVMDVPESITMDDLFARAAEMLAGRIEVPASRLHAMLMQREEDSSTVIFPGVAIPHIVVTGEKKSDMIVIRCRKGISFGNDDGSVHVIFILAGTRDMRNRHLKILSSIAQILQDPTFHERWMEATGEDALRMVLLDTERQNL